MQHSRNHILIIEEYTFYQTLAIKQWCGPEVSETQVLEFLEPSEHKQYELRNGLVYRKYNGHLLFYMTVDLCSNVIRKCNDNMIYVDISPTNE
ncbi:Integrase catalytic domain-containing protein [Aphis craccivora]|uniref:Integrase catalytic domain-containing protein n=1 Tax=Aphis craccivora TaxID=307492 RepID=A0A6G0YVG2_APHCR|nr:Integrase catalytic domain-containing protein [Aphis craccivora]